MPITNGVKCLGIILLIHGHFYWRKILQYIDNVTNILCHCLNTRVIDNTFFSSKINTRYTHLFSLNIITNTEIAIK